MQLAHPLVAAGVADHSGFASDPLARLRRTLDSTLAIVFGTRAEADAAVGRIGRVHGAVHGTLPEPAGRFAAGTSYDANDPDLAMWVQATLVDTTFTVYPLIVGALTRDEMDRAYAESKIVARLLGVPDDVIPPDVVAFRRYMDDMLASEAIAVAPFQRALAQDVLYPTLRLVPKRAFWPTVALTTALLPPRIRELYGLELTPARQRAAKWSLRAARGILPVLPRVVRDMPQSRGNVV
jgi:uncharacterized protein (DUF2236 family)